MTEKRFTTTGYYIYDHYKEDKWLVNEVEAQEIVDKMNNLDTKARENSKALSTLQKKYNALHEENQSLKFQLDECRNHKLFSRRELEKENEQLQERIKDWHQRTFKAHEYFNILEKVIDEVCNDDISNQIWKEYEKREKLIE